METKLSRPACKRQNAAAILDELAKLPVSPSSDFRDFFCKYRGPIGSDLIGYLLLDLIEDEPNILSSTQQLRRSMELSESFLVISDLLAGGVLIYDAGCDAVYDIDFEGTYDALLRHELTPEWKTFSSFLSDFFE